MKTYTITTDAISTEIEASDEDAAAVKFAKNEPVYFQFVIEGIADLIWAAKKMGGWANVEER